MLNKSNMFYRYKIFEHNDKYVIQFSTKRITAETKQLLYKKLKEDSEIKKIYTRKNSIVCTQKN